MALSRKQSGTVTITATNTSATATLTSYDAATSVLKVSARGTETAPEDHGVSVVKTDATTLTFTRGAQDGTSTIAWELLEFSSGVSVQDFELAAGGGTQAITSVDTSKSFILGMLRGDTANYSAEETVIVRLNSATEAEVVSSGTPEVCTIQVVEYDDCSVEVVTHDLTTTTLTSDTITVTSVDTSKAFIIGSSTTTAGAFTSFSNGLWRATLTNGTTVTIDRNGASSLTFSFSVQVVEFTGPELVQSGQIALAVSETTGDGTLSPAVDVSRTMTFLGSCHQPTISGGLGLTNASNDDVPEAAHTTSLPDSTTFRVTRTTSAARTSAVTFQAITWPVLSSGVGSGLLLTGTMGPRQQLGVV